METLAPADGDAAAEDALVDEAAMGVDDAAFDVEDAALVELTATELEPQLPKADWQPVPQ